MHKPHASCTGCTEGRFCSCILDRAGLRTKLFPNEESGSKLGPFSADSTWQCTGQWLIVHSHIPYTDKRTTEGYSSGKSQELFQKKQRFHCMAQRSQLVVCHHRAVLDHPKHQGTRGECPFASSNITIYSLANTFWCLNNNPKLNYTPLVSWVQVTPPRLTNVQSLKIGFWWWIQGLWAFQVTLTVC